MLHRHYSIASQCCSSPIALRTMSPIEFRTNALTNLRCFTPWQNCRCAAGRTIMNSLQRPWRWRLLNGRDLCMLISIQAPPLVARLPKSSVPRATTTTYATRALVADLIRHSRRPVIIAGVGCTALPANERQTFANALQRLTESSSIPVLTTYKARGVVDDRGPHAAGVATGATIESELLHAADLIIGLGLDPVEFIPAPWPYAAPVVLLGTWSIDDSSYFAGRLEAEVVNNLSHLVDQLAQLLRGDWPPDAAARARQRAITELEAAVPMHPHGLTPQQVVSVADACAPTGTVATVDAGAHMLVAVPLWQASGPHARFDLKRTGNDGLCPAGSDRCGTGRC